MTPEYQRAAEVAAHIHNILSSDHCGAVRFGKILFLILALIKESEARGFRRGSGIHYN